MTNKQKNRMRFIIYIYTSIYLKSREKRTAYENFMSKEWCLFTKPRQTGNQSRENYICCNDIIILYIKEINSKMGQ
jgi:hypothetical protein